MVVKYTPEEIWEALEQDELAVLVYREFVENSDKKEEIDGQIVRYTFVKKEQPKNPRYVGYVEYVFFVKKKPRYVVKLRVPALGRHDFFLERARIRFLAENGVRSGEVLDKVTDFYDKGVKWAKKFFEENMGFTSAYSMRHRASLAAAVIQQKIDESLLKELSPDGR